MSKMAILITGGAGYIGSVTNIAMKENGVETIIFDNFSRGSRNRVDGARTIEGDLMNKSHIDGVFRKNDIDAVIHLAAFAHVGESMKFPGMYFRNNVMGGMNLLESMKESGVKKIIFSSSCAIYGTPSKLPVTEEALIKPESVYAETKAMTENMVLWYEKQHDFDCTILRYFNVAGASRGIGEASGRMVSNAISSAINGSPLPIYGNDYPTRDGTCIRDYIHVEDVAQAHLLSLGKTGIYNLGYGNGVSNMEIVKAVEETTGKRINVKIEPRRPGDPPEIFASGAKARKDLGWKPVHDIQTIVKTSAEWMRGEKK